MSGVRVVRRDYLHITLLYTSYIVVYISVVVCLVAILTLSHCQSPSGHYLWRSIQEAKVEGCVCTSKHVLAQSDREKSDHIAVLQ